MDSRTTRIIAAVLVVALVALGLVLVFRDSGDTAPSEQAAATGWVVIDGWSWAMRGDTDLEVLVDGDVVEADFAPITESDLTELLTLDAGAVTELAARVTTADPSLFCDLEGCSTVDGPVELASIVTPTNEMLTGFGVTHGGYVARVGSEQALSLEVRVAGEGRGARLNMRPDLGPPADERTAVVTEVPGVGDVLAVPPPGAIGEEITEEELREIAEEIGINTEMTIPQDIDPVEGQLPAMPGDATLDPEIPIPEMDQSLPGGTGAQLPPPGTEPGGFGEPVDPAQTEVRGAVQLADAEGATPDTPVSNHDDDSSEPVDAPRDPRAPLPPVLVAGLAWGTVFPLEVPWLVADDMPTIGSFGVPRDYIDAVTNEVGDLPAPFDSGLSAAEEAAKSLTATQLTAWSSPLIGCGLGVVCAPTAEGVEIVENADPATVRLCYLLAAPSGISLDPEFADIAVAAAPVTVVLRDRAITFDATARTQMGAWPGDVELPNRSLWPLPVPVHNEAFTLQVRSAEIYDASGLLTVIGNQSPVAGDGVWDTNSLLASGASAVLRACE